MLSMYYLPIYNEWHTEYFIMCILMQECLHYIPTLCLYRNFALLEKCAYLLMFETKTKMDVVKIQGIFAGMIEDIPKK